MTYSTTKLGKLKFNLINYLNKKMKAFTRIEKVETSGLDIIFNDNNQATFTVDGEPCIEDLSIEDLKDLRDGLNFILDLQNSQDGDK